MWDSSTDEILSLLLNNHEFKFFYNHWKLPWLLTSKFVELIKIYVNCQNTYINKKIKNKTLIKTPLTYYFIALFGVFRVVGMTLSSGS